MTHKGLQTETTNKRCSKKTNLRTLAISVAPYQPVHPRSMIVSAIFSQISQRGIQETSESSIHFNNGVCLRMQMFIFR